MRPSVPSLRAGTSSGPATWDASRAARRFALGVVSCALLACGGLEPSDSAVRRGERPAAPGAAGSAAPGPGDAGASALPFADAAAIDPARPVDAGQSDDIYGQAVPRAESWWVEGGRLHRGDNEVRLHGVNWFGLETQSLALFGPSQARRTVVDILMQVKSLGFNALRVPLAPESIDPGHASASWANSGAIDTGREHFEALAQAAASVGIYMLWDVHTCAARVGHVKRSPSDPACGGYDDAAWIADLQTLAELALQYAPFVLGIDLFNEPYGLTHDAWRALAEQGGRAVLEKNPRLLVFVQGVGSEGYQGTGVFWGENLTGVHASPIDLPAARLVYSPHVYGPAIFEQAYFGAPSFPQNMPSIWDEHFGYLWDAGHAIVPGEFGGRYTGSDQVWQDAFVEYLRANDAPGYFYWCLNPNSGDTGGLLLDDWRSVNMGKLELLQRLLPMP